MSYGLSFIPPLPGHSLSESALVAGRIEIPPLKFTPDQLVTWHRIVERITAEVGPTEVETKSWCVEVFVTDGQLVAVSFWGTQAAARLPFRYDKTTTEAMTKLYRVAHIVEEETGLTGYDEQTELDVSDANLPAAIAHYRKTMEMVNFHRPPRKDETGII